MNDYTVFTDSGCDIALEILEEWGVKCCQLTFTFDDSDRVYSNYDMGNEEFYTKLREGHVAKTSATNIAAFTEAFEEELKKGNDILYIGFSSGISGTYNAGRAAANFLQNEYPDRKLFAIDTLSASAGLGLFIRLTLDKKEAGATIEEAAQYILDNRLNICHWFTVDDLMYLKRGGRISPTLAIAGSALGIKPVMHVDNEGHLINVSKARGRMASFKALAKKYDELAVNPSQGPVFISHGDCLDEAEKLASMIEEKHGVKPFLTYIGPVIGAHAGCGTVALFFQGKER